MKTFSKLAFTLSVLSLTAANFFAQTANAQERTPDAPPTPVPAEDNGSDAPVTHLNAARVKQTVQNVNNGGQPEVRVTNDIGTYVVKPNQNVGTSLPGDGQSNSNNPVQWIVKSWGGSKSTDKTDDAPPTLQPNPNAPDAK